MKVTQKQFDAKRKELSDVQDRKSNTKGHIDTVTRHRDSHNIDIENSQEDYSALAVEEFNVRAWLEDVWIEEDLSVDLTDVKIQSSEGGPYIAVRSFEEYRNKAYHLSNVFDWKLEVDSNGFMVLIPTKKPYKPNKP